MGRTACTESQCLYKGALYLFTLNTYCSTPEVPTSGSHPLKYIHSTLDRLTWR